MTRFTI